MDSNDRDAAMTPRSLAPPTGSGHEGGQPHSFGRCHDASHAVGVARHGRSSLHVAGLLRRAVGRTVDCSDVAQPFGVSRLLREIGGGDRMCQDSLYGLLMFICCWQVMYDQCIAYYNILQYDIMNTIYIYIYAHAWIKLRSICFLCF